MSTRDSDDGSIRYSVKELLLEIRKDVAAIDAKLDFKADRGRVDDLANQLGVLNMQQPMRERLIVEFRETQDEVKSLQAWRNRLAGGLLVVGSVAGLNLVHIWFGIG